jgi:hypothetical protein
MIEWMEIPGNMDILRNRKRGNNSGIAAFPKMAEYMNCRKGAATTLYYKSTKLYAKAKLVYHPFLMLESREWSGEREDMSILF